VPLRGVAPRSPACRAGALRLNYRSEIELVRLALTPSGPPDQRAADCATARKREPGAGLAPARTWSTATRLDCFGFPGLIEEGPSGSRTLLSEVAARRLTPWLTDLVEPDGRARAPLRGPDGRRRPRTSCPRGHHARSRRGRRAGPVHRPRETDGGGLAPHPSRRGARLSRAARRARPVHRPETPRPGLAPGTVPVTADRSTLELARKGSPWRESHPRPLRPKRSAPLLSYTTRRDDRSGGIRTHGLCVPNAALRLG
jgi:hypothetical protein